MPEGLEPQVVWTSALTGHCALGESFACVWKPQGSTLYTVSLAGGEVLRTFTKHKAPIVHVAVANDYVLSACSDGKVLLWGYQDGHVVSAAQASGPVTSLAVSRSGGVMVYADQEGAHGVEIKLSITAGTAGVGVRALDLDLGGRVAHLALDEGGQRLGAVRDGQMQVLSLADGASEDVARVGSRQVERLFWLKSRLCALQQGEQSQAILVFDGGKQRPLRVFDKGTALLFAPLHVLALEHHAGKGALRLSYWNLEQLARSKKDTAGLVVNCTIALPFLRSGALPAIKADWQDLYCASKGLPPARLVGDAGRVSPLCWRPLAGGVGLDLALLVEGQKQTLVWLRVQEPVKAKRAKPKVKAPEPDRAIPATTAEEEPEQEQSADVLPVLEEEPEEPAPPSPPSPAPPAELPPFEEEPVEDLAEVEASQLTAPALPEPLPPPRPRRSPPGPSPLKAKDVKGARLRDLLEARELLQDQHLLSSQRRMEVRSSPVLRLQAEQATALHSPPPGEAGPPEDPVFLKRSRKHKRRKAGTSTGLERVKQWDWSEWDTWSEYSKSWKEHLKGNKAVPLPVAPRSTHWLANPILGLSPYQPWQNRLQFPHPQEGLEMRNAKSCPSLHGRKVKRIPLKEYPPPTGVEMYHEKAKALVNRSARKAAAHYCSLLLEQKMQVVLGARTRPEVQATQEWRFDDQFRHFEQQMQHTEQIVQRAVKVQPAVIDPQLLSGDSRPGPLADVPLFAHFPPKR